MPEGSTFATLDPLTGQGITLTNAMTNFGQEYTWHCHILGHEENDMMRPLVLKMNDRIGIFRGNGQWYLDANGSGAWDAVGDKISFFGIAGDIPFTGDWNGSGTTKLGVYRNGQWYLDINGNGLWDQGTDKIYTFGLPGDIPIVGDWSGNGTTKIGVVRNAGGVLEFYLDMNGNGVWDPAIDRVTYFGTVGDIPVTGDWNGTGTTKIGVFRNGQLFRDMNGNGYWDAGTDQITAFGIAGDLPVTGDWNGTGTTKIGVFRNGTWYLDMNGNGSWDAGVDAIKTFGITGDKPVTGKW
jgi:hypothetical protein